jgi:hypothetical protein
MRLLKAEFGAGVFFPGNAKAKAEGRSRHNKTSGYSPVAAINKRKQSG